MTDPDLQSVEVPVDVDDLTNDVPRSRTFRPAGDHPVEEDIRSDGPPTHRRRLSIRSRSTRSILSTITLRESGLLSKTKYDNLVYQARLRYPNKARCRYVDTTYQGMDLVRNSGSYFFLFGEGNYDEIHRYQFGYWRDRVTLLGFKRRYTPSRISVQDVCDISDSHIIYIANSLDPNRNSQNLITVKPVGYSGIYSDWKVESQLRCCVYDSTKELIVVGTATNLLAIHSFHLLEVIEDVDGDIYSVAMRNYGHGVIYSERNGNIYNVDFRTDDNDLVAEMRSGIHQMKTLDNEHEVIVSGYENQLSLIDLRMKRVSREFREHVNNDRIIPFSYCDATKLLCSAGEDNRIRIWSLDQSNPLADLPSPNKASSTEANYSFLRKENTWHRLHNFCRSQMTVYNLKF